MNLVNKKAFGIEGFFRCNKIGASLLEEFDVIYGY